MVVISVAALVCATLFAGAAAYISLVEHPARLQLEDGPLLAQWQPSYARALPIQSGLAAGGGAAGLAVWYFSGGWLWALGSVLLLANWPFTLMVIMPTNKRLKAIDPANADARSRSLLMRWGRLHDVRSVLGLASMLILATAIAQGH